MPLMVARGYASLTFLHSAAKAIQAKASPPSSITLATSTRPVLTPPVTSRPSCAVMRLRPGSLSSGWRSLREQVTHWNLPTRPTKMTDTRAKKFNPRHLGRAGCDSGAGVARAGPRMHRAARRPTAAQPFCESRTVRARTADQVGAYSWRRAMIAARRRLPNRRGCETFSLECAGLSYTASIRQTAEWAKSF